MKSYIPGCFYSVQDQVKINNQIDLFPQSPLASDYVGGRGCSTIRVT